MAPPNHCKRQCPAARKLWAHLDYCRKENLYKERAKASSKRNYPKRREYFSRPEVLQAMRERTREWVANNKDRKRADDAAFKKKNRSLVTSYKAKYRASRRNATPAWLTEEHWIQIRAVYAEAERLTQETGVPHEVDHIVPLQGKTVCGLHVPWNLRAIPRVENNRRPRVWVSS